MREIITVQVGGFANFIGSHFWNFQDELLGLADDPYADEIFKHQQMDMDVLYRSGETPQGILTYSPRLVSIDFQGTLGAMNSRGSLYDSSPATKDVYTWEGNISTHTSEPQKKNLFLQSLDDEKISNKNKGGEIDHGREYQEKDIVECLESGVKFWTDYTKVLYHPKSLTELSGLWMDAADFSNYGIGKEALHCGHQGEEIIERLRFFVEECDHIQGFQFIVDDSGGFSAVAAEFLENIADDYTNTPVLLYTARDPRSYKKLGQRNEKIFQVLHDAVSFSRLSSLCQLIVPMGLPFLSTSKACTFLSIEDEKPYHSSAVYASALHSTSIPFRMQYLRQPADPHDVSGAINMNDMVRMLSDNARKNTVAILDISMPAPSLRGKDVRQSLLSHFHPLTYEIEEDVEDLHSVEAVNIHGVIGPGGHRASVSEVKDSVDYAYDHAKSRPKFCHLSATRTPLPIPLPFPSIFSSLIGSQGELQGGSTTSSLSRGSLDVHSIPLATRLRMSNAILPYLESRLNNLMRFGIQRGAAGSDLIRGWGLSRDELEDMGESLTRMVMNLKPGDEISDDSD
ncbi:hypothetical protein SAY87_030543 [Trapa incisa]|uniref:Protein misato homolog 1 n=1 Tax=Trapa incisa TaxID=236973 RepID=A0AAN7QK99_9MYRT|nr:hypothetical protein SAY87_030543 [Trapa incisa]